MNGMTKQLVSYSQTDVNTETTVRIGGGGGVETDKGDCGGRVEGRDGEWGEGGGGD